jgi:hypothetical protein
MGFLDGNRAWRLGRAATSWARRCDVGSHNSFSCLFYQSFLSHMDCHSIFGTANSELTSRACNFNPAKTNVYIVCKSLFLSRELRAKNCTAATLLCLTSQICSEQRRPMCWIETVFRRAQERLSHVMNAICWNEGLACPRMKRGELEHKLSQAKTISELGHPSGNFIYQ